MCVLCVCGVLVSPTRFRAIIIPMRGWDDWHMLWVKYQLNSKLIHFIKFSLFAIAKRARVHDVTIASLSVHNCTLHNNGMNMHFCAHNGSTVIRFFFYVWCHFFRWHSRFLVNCAPWHHRSMAFVSTYKLLYEIRRWMLSAYSMHWIECHRSVHFSCTNGLNSSLVMWTMSVENVGRTMRSLIVSASEKVEITNTNASLFFWKKKLNSDICACSFMHCKELCIFIMWKEKKNKQNRNILLMRSAATNAVQHVMWIYIETVCVWRRHTHLFHYYVRDYDPSINVHCTYMYELSMAGMHSHIGQWAHRLNCTQSSHNGF